MNKNFFFETTKDEISRKKNKSEIKPMTAGEQEEVEQRPMTPRDHWLSLRQSVQEKADINEPETPEEQERMKLLREIVGPELIKNYGQILKKFKEKTKKSQEHPQREFIDISDEEFSEEIESWIECLILAVKNKKGIETSESETGELRAQCWLIFDSIGSVMNAKTVEKDILEFYKDKNVDELDKKEQEEKKAELKKELQSRYPLDRAEIEILVDLVKPSEGDNYSLRILIETVARLWKEYNLGDKKGDLAKISLGYLVAKGAESYAPSLFQNLLVGDKFNLMVYLEYFALGKFANVLDTQVDIKLERIINEINHEINKKMTNSLFFREFEFIHEKSLGEIYIALERGKGATTQLITDVISRFAPALAGIGLSWAFLLKINPILGAIGLSSLPIMYKIARWQSSEMHPIYEKLRDREEEMVTRLESMKRGFEEIKTSPDAPSVARHVSGQLNSIDNISLDRSIKRKKMWLMEKIPFDVADVISASVGVALQQSGHISSGAVLSNIIYSRQLTQPVESLVNLYFNEFARNIQEIRHADKIFGEYEKLDLPEGEKEKKRLPVSELKNFDISIKNLRYKNILRGINMDIKQGEFMTIAGASGAGKSTLLRNLAGLYKPDGGNIEIGGVENGKIKKYGKESLYSIMSYCNQDPQIFEGMTLRENLLLWSKEKIDDDKIKKVLEDLHLDQFAGRLDEEIKHLSGGEKVRIGVARTLIKGAKIMLLDEPTASLDSQAATEVRKIIREINEKYPDTTIICVSHDEELFKISKRSINLAELQK